MERRGLGPTSALPPVPRGPGRRSSRGLQASSATLAALLALLLTGCTSSSGAASAAVSKTCQAIAAVLSNGPDPTADPVGYAEAQVGPLRRIATSDARLDSAVANLADAYQEFFTTDGSAAAQRAVNAASRKVEALCPGASS